MLKCYLTLILLFHLFVAIQYAVFSKSLTTFSVYVYIYIYVAVIVDVELRSSYVYNIEHFIFADLSCFDN